MTKTIHVKGLTIGEGIPKICVPLVGRTRTEILDEAEYIKTLDIDIVEWRADYYEDVQDIEKVKIILSELRSILSETPLVFTFRSHKEGGEREVSAEYYAQLNRAAIDTQVVDFVDVELFSEETIVKATVEHAHSKGIYVIVSNHDFFKTPDKEEILSRLRKAQDFGADIPKMAVMPQNVTDVLTLLDATNTMNEKYAKRPLITMAMSHLGKISRMSGEVFGSSVTFAAAQKSSAPGQIPVTELRQVLTLLHNT